MIGRRYIDEDYAPALVVGNAEPFRKPDHRAKKHPKPRSKHCRGRVAFRSDKPGRVLAMMEDAE